jgi:hypothetical protein
MFVVTDELPGVPLFLTFLFLSRYSVNMQVVCDVDKRIIAIHLGCPGSCADSSVYKRMPIYKLPQLYFSPGEFILADSAYALSTTCIPAYKAPAANEPKNAEFNYCLARSRVRNEHSIGILKSRWASLREMRQQLRTKEDMQGFKSWVVACCVLHNMLARLGDAWDDIFDDDEEDEDQTSYFEKPSDSSHTFREVLKKTTLETNYAHGVLPIN